VRVGANCTPTRFRNHITKELLGKVGPAATCCQPTREDRACAIVAGTGHETMSMNVGMIDLKPPTLPTRKGPSQGFKISPPELMHKPTSSR
jgi:hypothetical protein